MHYFSHSNYEESRKYFIKSFAKFTLNNDNVSYQFHFQLKEDENMKSAFLYLKDYIIGFPPF